MDYVMWQCHTVRQASEVLNKEKQKRNLKEVEFISRRIGVAISTRGWPTASKEPDKEVNVKQLLVPELVASRILWSEASLLEENLVGYRPSGISVIKDALKTSAIFNNPLQQGGNKGHSGGGPK